MADKRISQLIERVDIANNDVLPIVASGATTTNKVTISTIQDWMQSNLDVGVTSVGLTMPSAFVVSSSPVTTSGNINVTGAGTVSQYIRGDGSLADFPSQGGGGSSVSYYLNGSVDQGTIGGIAYKEMNKNAILGAGTDFVAIADGYLASFITDAGDPALLEIPSGNWNFETYFSASSSGGTPSFYIELYKVSAGGTATLIASNSAAPELIAFGTTITPYFSALAVPTTSLALTDRLALRYYVSRSGRTITLHTENSHLCQIITTFTTGLTALNGLTAQVQNFATGTSGTDFGISSSVSTHTFNLPDASASARGVVTTGTQTFAGYKIFNGTIGVNQDIQLATQGTALNTFIKNINATGLTSIGSNGFGFNNANNIYFSGSSKGGGVFAFNNTGTQTYTLPDASGTLAFTSDLGNYIQGVGTADSIPKFTGARTIANSAIRDTTSTVVISKNVSVDNGASQAINLTPASGGTTNRIETTGTLPLAIITSGSSITLAAGGTTPQITLASTGAVTLTGALNGTSATFTAAGSTFVSTTTTGGSDMRISSGATLGYVGTTSNHPLSFVVANGVVANFDTSGVLNLGAALNGVSASFTGKLSVTQASTDFVAEITNTQNATPYGLRIKDAASGANGYPLLSVSNNAGSVEYFRVNSGTGAATFSSSVTAGGQVSINAGNGNQLYLNNSGQRYTQITFDNNSSGTSKAGIWFDNTSNVFDLFANTGGSIRMLTGGVFGSPALTLSSTGAATFSSSAFTVATFNSTFGQMAISFANSGTTFSQIGSGVSVCSTAAADDLGFGTAGLNKNIVFATGTGFTERMRITSGGAVQVGIAAAGTNVNFNINGVANKAGRIQFMESGSPIWLLGNGAASENGRFEIYDNVNGTGVQLLRNSTSWTSLSDERFKDIIEPISVLDKLKNVRAVVGKYKTDEEGIRRNFVIAQDLLDVFPEVVDIDEDEEKPMGVRYTDLIPILIASIQEQQEQIKSLTEQVEALKSQING